MNSKQISPSQSLSRRQFLRGSLAVGTSLLAGVPRGVFAAHDSTIRLALIGCGGRGAGAVRDALSVSNSGPMKLWAMADLYDRPIQERHEALANMFGNQVEVPRERRFTGFQAYKDAIDSLQPGDIAMCTTRAYIRPVHVEYAVKKGIHVFMEKPFASDPSGLHRLLAAGQLAEEKGVKIAAGLQCRHSPARQALIERIRNGDMGDIPLVRANRLGGSRWLDPQGPKAFQIAEQLQFGRIHLLWVGSGHMVDNLIHQIDECCWIKDAWPTSCVGMGGREPLTTDCGQNLDIYSMEYTFPDGAKAFCGFRRQNRARTEFATFIHGTKCAAQFSGQTHAATVHMFKDQRIERSNISWTPPKDVTTPWQYEWNDFIESIRNDRPHNEARRAVFADFTSLMGRAACHLGREITWEDMLRSRFAFCDSLDDLDFDSPVPVKPDDNGAFPVPRPGAWDEIGVPQHASAA